MSADALTVRAENADAEPLTSAEGAGAVSSFADFGNALGEDEPDGLQIAFTAAGAGLDTLGAIADPFDALLTSAVGWLIEHLWFLHEPLDALAGDPKQIVAQAQTWQNVSTALGAIATSYRETSDLSGWEGESREAYGGAVTGYTTALRGTAAQAERLAQLVLGTGAAVGTVRALIRDLIAEFLGGVIEKGIIWLATLAPSGGVSTAYFVAAVVAEAVALAQDVARRISRLLDALSDAAGTAGQIVDRMRYLTAEVRVVAAGLPTAVAPVTELLDSAPTGEVVEAGKQFTGAKLDDEVTKFGTW